MGQNWSRRSFLSSSIVAITGTGGCLQTPAQTESGSSDDDSKNGTALVVQNDEDANHTVEISVEGKGSSSFSKEKTIDIAAETTKEFASFITKEGTYAVSASLETGVSESLELELTSGIELRSIRLDIYKDGRVNLYAPTED